MSKAKKISIIGGIFFIPVLLLVCMIGISAGHSIAEKKVPYEVAYADHIEVNDDQS